MSSQDERRAQNENTFREANEQIKAAGDQLRPPLERTPYVCECADVACRELVTLTVEEYEEVRADGRRFLVAPGHEHDSEVVEEHAGWAVVVKEGVAGAVASEKNPRRAV